MKICKNCGEILDENAKNCKKCGAEVIDLNIKSSEVNSFGQGMAGENISQNQASNNSTLSRFYKNLSYYLRFTLSPFILCLFTALCCYGIVFFNDRQKIYIELEEEALRQSSSIMILIFSFFLIMFAALLFLSVYLNIKKFASRKKNKK